MKRKVANKRAVTNRLPRLEVEQATPATTDSRGTIIRLFISHSSKDEAFVKRLLRFLQSTLGLPSNHIRCTSVEGYRLSAGTKFFDRLKTEVCQAEVVVVAVSKQSLSSAFVLFELGARWGTGRVLLPVLTPGTLRTDIHGPLTELHSLLASNRADMKQLIGDTAEALQINPATLKPFARSLSRFMRTSESRSTAPAPRIPAMLLDAKTKQHVIAIGSTVEYSVRVTNAGNTPLTNVVLVVTALGHAKINWLSSRGPSGRGLTRDNAVVFPPFPTLAPGCVLDYGIDFAPLAYGGVRLEAKTKSDQVTVPLVHEVGAFVDNRL